MKRTYLSKLLLLLLLGLLTTQAFAQDKQGKKKRIAVFTFDDKSQSNYGWWGNKTVGNGVADMIITELVKSGKYRVLERSELDQLLREQDLGASGIVTPETAAQMGKVLGVEIAVFGAVTEYGFKKENTGVRIGGTGLGVGKQSAVTGLDLRMVNTSTGEILTAENVRAQRNALSGNVNVKNVSFDNERSFDESLVGKSAREAVEKVVALVNEKAETIPWSAKVITVQGGQVYINSGSQDGVQVGEVFVVMRKGKALVDPDTGLELGSVDSEIGRIKVVDNSVGNGKASICSIVSGTGFDRGDVVKE